MHTGAEGARDAVTDVEVGGEATADGDTLGEAEMQTHVYWSGAPQSSLQQMSPRHGEEVGVREAEAATEREALDEGAGDAVTDVEADGEATVDGDTLGEAEMQMHVYSSGAPHPALQQISPTQGVTEGLVVREAAMEDDTDVVGAMEGEGDDVGSLWQ